MNGHSHPRLSLRTAAALLSRAVALGKKRDPQPGDVFKPLVPQARGGLLESGRYKAPNGDVVVYVDYVIDPELYRISQRKRGWATIRSEPGQLSDAQVQAHIAHLQARIRERYPQPPADPEKS